jgi:hypothetical protein
MRTRKTPPGHIGQAAIMMPAFIAAESIRSGYNSQAGGRDSTGLAWHGLCQALTFECGRQVRLTTGKEARKKLHVSLHKVAKTGRLRVMEWGSSLPCI